MGRHRVPGEPAVARLTRPLRTDAADEAPGTEGPTSRSEARRGGSRHSWGTRRHGLARLAAQPWLTLVLLVLVAGVGLSVLRPDTYAATATVTATTDRAAADGAVALTRTDLVPRVEEAIELADVRAGRIRVAIDRPPDRPQLLVTTTARDPRLAALAADTAAALVVSEREDALSLTTPAAVPTRPVDRLSPWWAVGGLTALALALLVERLHERWELRHTPVRRAVEEPA
jgi:hypothetical protein